MSDLRNIGRKWVLFDSHLLQSVVREDSSGEHKEVDPESETGSDSAFRSRKSKAPTRHYCPIGAKVWAFSDSLLASSDWRLTDKEKSNYFKNTWIEVDVNRNRIPLACKDSGADTNRETRPTTCNFVTPWQNLPWKPIWGRALQNFLIMGNRKQARFGRVFHEAPPSWRLTEREKIPAVRNTRYAIRSSRNNSPAKKYHAESPCLDTLRISQEQESLW